MTRLITLGAETAADLTEGITNSAAVPTYSSAAGTFRSGAWSYKFDGGAGAAMYHQAAFTGAVGTRYFAAIWFRLPAATGLPATSATVISFLQSTTVLCQARLMNTGKIRLLDQAAVQIGSDSTATIAADTWYRLELVCQIAVGSTDYAELRLANDAGVDEVVASTSSGAFTDSAPTGVRFGWNTTPGAGEIMYMDDFALNDNAGSVNNTYVGGEKVVLLLPTADSTRDAGWVGGASGTTNLWEAVNNIPPVGLSNAAATDTSQIENAVSTTTQVYAATMQTYTAAGLASTDIVTSVYGVIAGGNSSTTGTDTLGVQVTSNPAITEVTPSIDILNATFPSGWLLGATAITENPSLTFGTAPVMQVRKNIAAGRVSACCLMGMYVSYISPTAKSASDSQSLSISDSAAGSAAYTNADSQVLSITDGQSITATAAASDSQGLSVTDSATFAYPLSVSDSQSLTSNDAATLAATATATDSQSLTSDDTAAATAALTAADSTTPSITETLAIAITIADTSTLGIAETTVVPEAAGNALSAEDSQSLNADDSVVIAAAATATDSQALSSDDTAAAVAALTTTDTQSLTADDVASMTAPATASDTQVLTSMDTASVATQLVVADVRVLVLTDEATVEMGAPATRRRMVLMAG